MMMMNVNGFQKGVLKYLKEFHEIFKYFKVKYFIVHLYVGCWKKEHGKKKPSTTVRVCDNDLIKNIGDL